MTNVVVEMKIQGVAKEIETGEFPQETINAWLTYGARRWFQDSINSLAKQARDNGQDIDEAWVQDTYMERLNAALSGKLSTRKAATESDPLDKYRISVLRQAMRDDPDGELSTEYGKIPSDDQAGRKAFLLAVAAKHSDMIDPLAKKALAADQRAADAVADVAASITL